MRCGSGSVGWPRTTVRRDPRHRAPHVAMSHVHRAHARRCGLRHGRRPARARKKGLEKLERSWPPQSTRVTTSLTHSVHTVHTQQQHCIIDPVSLYKTPRHASKARAPACSQVQVRCDFRQRSRRPLHRRGPPRPQPPQAIAHWQPRYTLNVKPGVPLEPPAACSGFHGRGCA